jgi:hypothetical protein
VEGECRDEQFCKKKFNENNYNSYIVFLALFLVFFLSLSIFIHNWARGTIKVYFFKKNKIDQHRRRSTKMGSKSITQRTSMLSSMVGEDDTNDTPNGKLNSGLSGYRGLGSMNVKEVESKDSYQRSYGGIIGSFGKGAGFRYTPDSDSD